jgi:uncharacterized protein YqkB
MYRWYDLGYFQDELEIAYGENSMFLPLKSYKEISENVTPNQAYNNQ